MRIQSIDHRRHRANLGPVVRGHRSRRTQAQLRAYRRMGPEARARPVHFHVGERVDLALAGIPRAAEYDGERLRRLLRLVLGGDVAASSPASPATPQRERSGRHPGQRPSSTERVSLIAGSFASTFAEARRRTTQDIDIVIDPTGRSLAAFVASLPQTNYYVSEDAALNALRRRSQFNVIDMATGWKVDLIVRKARPFASRSFAVACQRRSRRRRVRSDAGGHDPHQAGVRRQCPDPSGNSATSPAFSTSNGEVDRRQWAVELGVLDLWRRVEHARGRGLSAVTLHFFSPSRRPR